jgi:DNA-directed RNA polymerase subunit RPC12/RpoP
MCAIKGETLSKRRTWKCDMEGCTEIAEWYRKIKGITFKFCTRHEAIVGRQQRGKPLSYSELSVEDIEELEDKDRMFEYACSDCGHISSVPIGNAIVTAAKPLSCQKCGKVVFSIRPAH